MQVLWAMANGKSQTSLTIDFYPQKPQRLVILIGTFRRFEGLKLFSRQSKRVQKNKAKNPIPNHLADF